MRERKPTGPRECLEHKPTHQSIRFGGRYISLKMVTILTEYDHGYLSYVFSGKRTPSLAAAKKIAKALGMNISDFLTCIDLRIAELKAKSDKSMEFARRHRTPEKKTA